MRSNCILSFFLLINSTIYTQEKDLFRNSLFLNLKAGYHTGFKPDQNNGFPGGFAWDAALSYGINNFLAIGVNLESWNKKDIYRPHKGNENISAISYGINFRFKKSIFKGSVLYLGAGLGNYSISRKYSIPGNDNQMNYLSLFLLFGTDIKVYRNLFLTAECNLTGLIGGIDYGGNKSDPAIINFKIGPAFLFNLP